MSISPFYGHFCLYFLSLLLLLFLTFSVLVANPKKTTLHGCQSRSDSGLLNRGKKKGKKKMAAPLPPPPPSSAPFEPNIKITPLRRKGTALLAGVGVNVENATFWGVASWIRCFSRTPWSQHCVHIGGAERLVRLLARIPDKTGSDVDRDYNRRISDNQSR